jgi:hypothetical protein
MRNQYMKLRVDFPSLAGKWWWRILASETTSREKIIEPGVEGLPRCRNHFRVRVSRVTTLALLGKMMYHQDAQSTGRAYRQFEPSIRHRSPSRSVCADVN